MKGRVLALAIILLLAGCGEKVNYPEKTPPEGILNDPGQQSVGKALFMQKCAGCHGSLEEGRNPRANDYTPTPSDFTRPVYAEKDPAYLYWRIARGKQAEPFRSRGSVMPSWGPHLSEEQIWQLVAYIRSRAVK